MIMPFLCAAVLPAAERVANVDISDALPSLTAIQKNI